MTDRQSTHGRDCWSWGPKHYECALREIERLRKMHQDAYQRGLQAGSRGLREMYDAVQAVKRQDAWGNAQLTEALVEAEERAERAEAENKQLRADLMESDEIREKLGHLLTRTAAALKGEPPEGVWHSWHDLPERAALATTRADKLAEALEEIRSRSTMDLAFYPDSLELITRLGDIYQIADAALSKENSNVIDHARRIEGEGE